MRLKDIYGNTNATGFSFDFFELTAPMAKSALLASPFYSTYDPVGALTSRGCDVRMIVRLCSVTTPQALRKAHLDPKVSVRYFTDQRFHAKFYIVDDVAMVGSANLTNAGLKSNREVSVILERYRDTAFDALPGIFDDLWGYADVLTDTILKDYERAFQAPGRPQSEDEFDKFLEKFVPKCSPSSIVVGSHAVNKQRAFLQRFRRKYDEILVPAHRRVMAVAQAHSFGRQEFKGADPQIEMGRFLGWVRLAHGAGETWKQNPVLQGEELDNRIRKYAELWKVADDIVLGDMFKAEAEIRNIEKIRTLFGDQEQLGALEYDDLFDVLTGCHAFLELLRFTNGGLEGLRADFKQRNALKDIKRTIDHLIRGGGDVVQRAYDCIHDERFRLQRFGESCVMELAGWITPNRPPFNSRTIKGLRFLGFDVEDFA
ncbi:phospholipase D-like domain-containing protein [Rhizobium phaseoli]|uniref:phospholipase D-like domain-containing protein n=1 Tax=Rhizobium phaseoli TaxID=396 RepID=UPI0007F15AFE|nr:phospholipase D-like domain-containing protein [Rhizobium phaseoli]ANL28599.1 phospholipase D-like domain-containing protein [Rhizobium phaseoli]